MTDPTNPLIVQSDLTVLLEVASPKAGDARAELARFAELERAPEHIHTYRITPLSLWNAAVAGVGADDVVDTLVGFAKYDVPPIVVDLVREQIDRYGRVWLASDAGELVLCADDDVLLDELSGLDTVAPLLGDRLDRHRFRVRHSDRGVLKQALLAAGWPAGDEAGFEPGTALDVGAALTTDLRQYQREALNAWWRGGDASGGSGVVVLPCGAGKTVVGLAALAAAGTHTLVVCTSVSSIRQWMRETCDKTSLTADQLGEWSGHKKQLQPITFVTYQSLTWRDPDAAGDELFSLHPHLGLFNDAGWGLVIYDEVHLLPAPVFRAAARVQAVRRLGLTATLVREDGREADIFSLIGPKRFDAPWAEVEAQGWIAPATCVEVRVALTPEHRSEYAATQPRHRHRLAATAVEKIDVVEALVARHAGEGVLVIGQFVDQLRTIADHLGAPLLTGQTGQATRDRLFGELRAGTLDVLVVSKIANFSIDLPEVSVAIQVSGQYGSRQEEAQRLGRILRPKADGGTASFYTIVVDGTDEVRFARNRQRFLAEQGYAYRVVDATDL